MTDESQPTTGSDDKNLRSYRSFISTASWVFVSLFLLFLIGIFIFAPPNLPEYKQRILGLSCAMLAGLSIFFLTGDIISMVFTQFAPTGRLTAKATLGAVVFLLVGSWWLTPFAPISTENKDGIYRLRVTVIDPRNVPIDDAKVWSSFGGEPRKVAGGWQFDIPTATKPQDGKLSLFASKESAFLTGIAELTLSNDFNPAVTIALKRDDSAKVRGQVVDNQQRAVVGARVSVVGYESEAVITKEGGNFELPAHAAFDQQVMLQAQKPGFSQVKLFHPAGDIPVVLVLKR